MNKEAQELGRRVKQLRRKKGWTQTALAKNVGVTRQAISKLEGGGTQFPPYINELAKALSVSTAHLLYDSRSDTLSPGPEIRGKYPLISWATAGEWDEVMDNFHPGEAEAWYRSPVNCSERTFVLRVNGVSMEPEFEDGDLIFVDPEAPATHKSFVVVRLDERNEQTFKQLIIEGDRQYLKALNPNWPDPIFLVSEKATICGVVVGKFKDYRR